MGQHATRLERHAGRGVLPVGTKLVPLLQGELLLQLRSIMLCHQDA
jgi:hypothetical protein